jgi:predicted signal transduction protein with EAL and GGDEF domain
MYHERVSPRYYIFGVAWLLLGLVLGLHLPDIDNRLQGLIPSWLLLHRSILTHGCLLSLLLFWPARRREGAEPSFRLFALGLSLALAVHLCFDFFPRGWVGFALIHVPVYGRTTALFSQVWLILSVVACLYVGFRLVRNVLEFTLGVGGLIISFIISAVENRYAVFSAFMLLAFATVMTIVMSRRDQKWALRRT